MAREEKRKPRDRLGRPPNARGYRTRQAVREGAPPPPNLHPLPPNLRDAIADWEKYPREPKAMRRRNGPQYGGGTHQARNPAETKMEEESPRSVLSKLPIAPHLRPPITMSPGVHLNVETPSPLVKIETPAWQKPAGSIRIEPPLGFFRGQAANSPMISRAMPINAKAPEPSLTEFVQGNSSEKEDRPTDSAKGHENANQTCAPPPSQLHTKSLPENQVPVQETVTQVGQQPPVPNNIENGEDSPLDDTSVEKKNETGPQQLQATPKRLNLIEPVGPLRLIYPGELVTYIFDTTFFFIDQHGQSGAAYQVTAYVDVTSDGSTEKTEVYCGTFAQVEKANEKVMQVFGRDAFELMGSRYEDMRFREAGEPEQGDKEVAGKRGPWTAFSFDAVCPTLRLWAKGESKWSFRVEAIKV